MIRLVGLTLVVLACSPASTRAPSTELDPRAARLCGTWRGEGDEGTIVEERWRVSDEGLSGEGVTLDAHGQRVTGESFVIVLRPDGSTYRALPEGATDWTEFEQTEDRSGATSDEWTWVWSNPAHDFPSTIRYASTARDRVQASVSGSDGRGGTQGFGWALERIEACTPPRIHP